MGPFISRSGGGWSISWRRICLTSCAGAFFLASALREVTPDKVTAWQVDWDSSYLLGHVTLVDDLYALTGSP